jgi:hypothetical protein
MNSPSYPHRCHAFHPSSNLASSSLLLEPGISGFDHLGALADHGDFLVLLTFDWSVRSATCVYFKDGIRELITRKHCQGSHANESKREWPQDETRRLISGCAVPAETSSRYKIQNHGGDWDS